MPRDRGGPTSDPVTDLARRLDDVSPFLAVRRMRVPAPGWTRCADLLADPTGLADWLKQVTREVRRQHPGWTPPTVTPASYLMGWYLDLPAQAGALAFGVARRVPELGPASLGLHLDPGGWPDGVALLGNRFSCLPGDPDAGHALADVVPHDQALAAVLRARVAEHAAAFQAVWSPAVRIGSRQRWGMLTDALDTALWTAGTARGDEDAGVRDARMVLDGEDPPFVGSSRSYRLVDAHGRERWSRRRLSCCFLFRVPGAQACTTCPRVGDAERAQRATDLP